MIVLGTPDDFHRAVRKASNRDTARYVRQVHATVFEVPSHDGATTYELWAPEGGAIRCTCPAGQRDLACYHAAAVLLFVIGARAPGRKPKSAREVDLPGSHRCLGPNCPAMLTSPGRCKGCAFAASQPAGGQ